jgi:SAM-dependent methyltransferase
MENADKLKDVVKEKYAKIAVQQKKCCCGSESKAEYSVFNEPYENLDGYIQEADLNLGCGLPTEHAGLKEGDSVIDLGCGAGNDCFVARSIVGESGQVTGLDFTDEMLVKARQNAGKLGYNNVNFVKGDIENIPVEDQSYDVVISNCVLNLVPDKDKAFAEIKRILKYGGHFCVSDIVLKGELPDKVRESASLYAGCVSGALQMEEYLEIIEKAGFRLVEVKKERIIEIPDDILLKEISAEELQVFRDLNTGIYSITVVAFA